MPTTTPFPRELILIVTYKCNLHCGYCPVETSEESMPAPVAEKAAALFLQHCKNGSTIRFFGGEPLFNIPAIEAAIDTCDKLGKHKNITFNLSSNGSLLDSSPIEKLQGRRDFELILSIDGARATQTRERTGRADSCAWIDRAAPVIKTFPLRSVNKVVSPDNISSLIKDILYIINKGYNSINILPAYYTEWSPAAIEKLRHGFKLLARLIAKLENEGTAIRIKNLELQGDSPLFNSAMVVDADGSVYGTNTIMHPALRARKHELALTNVDSFNPRALLQPDNRPAEYLTNALSPQVMESTRKADAELTRFVQELERTRRNSQT